MRWPRPPSFSILSRACLVLAAIALIRVAWFHLVVEEGWRLRWGEQPGIEARYQALKRVVPAEPRRLGYLDPVADPMPYGDRLFLQAGYSLAPHVLVRGAQGHDLVVANFESVADVRRICEESGLEPVALFDNGTALLRPRAPVAGGAR